MKKRKEKVEQKKTFSFRLRPTVVRQLRHACIDLEISQGELLEKIIEEFLQKHEKKG